MPATDIIDLISQYIGQDRAEYLRWYVVGIPAGLTRNAAATINAALSPQLDHLYLLLSPIAEANWRSADSLITIRAAGGTFKTKWAHLPTTAAKFVYAPTQAEKPTVKRLHVDLRPLLAELTLANPDPDLTNVFQQYVNSDHYQRLIEEEDREEAERERVRREREQFVMAQNAMLASVDAFSGEDPSYDVSSFLTAVQAACDLAKLNEAERCSFARLKLRGPAREFLLTDPD